MFFFLFLSHKTRCKNRVNGCRMSNLLLIGGRSKRKTGQPDRYTPPVYEKRKPRVLVPVPVPVIAMSVLASSLPLRASAADFPAVSTHIVFQNFESTKRALDIASTTIERVRKENHDEVQERQQLCAFKRVLARSERDVPHREEVYKCLQQEQTILAGLTRDLDKTPHNTAQQRAVQREYDVCRNRISIYYAEFLQLSDDTRDKPIPHVCADIATAQERIASMQHTASCSTLEAERVLERAIHDHELAKRATQAVLHASTESTHNAQVLLQQASALGNKRKRVDAPM